MISPGRTQNGGDPKGSNLNNATGVRKLKYHAQLWFFSLDWATQNVIHLFAAVVTLLAATGLGGVVFSALETDAGIAVNEQYAAAMVTLKSQLNRATGSDASYWNNLVGTIGATDPAQLPAGYDTWGYTSYKSFLFAFTIITTIGYGEISPKTIGGRLWLCAYAVVRLAGPAMGPYRNST